jgi:hypothetical protein
MARPISASGANPTARLTKPDPNAATAPSSPISRSDVPCTATRSVSGTDSDSSAEPATIEQLHPTPRNQRPTNTIAALSRATAVTIVASTMIAAPAMSTGMRPWRSLRRPITGESAYIPEMCSAMTPPVSVAEWP